MGKLVEIRLDGRLQEQRPIRVFLSIGEDAGRPGEVLPRASFEDEATLPYSPELHGAIAQWRSSYRNAAAPSRIRPVSVQQVSSRPAQVAECRNATDHLVQTLHDWLDEPSFRKLENALRDQVLPQEPLRILLRTGDRDIQRLPWQKWHFFDSHPNAECAFSSLRTERIQRKGRSPGKVRILAILGNSEGIDIEADRQMLADLPDADVTFLPKPGETEVQRSDLTTVWQKNWDIIFFAGHTESVDEEDNAIVHINQHESMKISELWFALRTAVDNGLQLAIFNSCDGLEISRHLDDEINIPQVIVMRDLVPDRIAQEFLKSFLHFYTQGSPLYVATRRARESLQHLENDYPCASLLPVIFQNPLEIPLNWDHFQDDPDSNSISLREIKASSNDHNPASLKSWQVLFTLKQASPKIYTATVLLCSLGVAGTFWLSPRISQKLNAWVDDEMYNKRDSPAILLYKLSILFDRENAAPKYNMGSYYEITHGNFSEAEAAYRLGHKLDDSYSSAGLARILALQDGKHKEAYQIVNQGLRSKTLTRISKTSLLRTRAYLQKEEGYLEDALQSLKEALDLDSEAPFSLCLMAQVLEDLNRNEEALSFWERWHKAEDNLDEIDKSLYEHSQCQSEVSKS